MKTALATALLALVSLHTASAFDNQNCQTFLTGLWVGEERDPASLTIAALSKSGKALVGFGRVPSSPGQGQWLARTWTAKPGSAPERCILVMKGLDSDGKENVKESELSVVDDNTINIFNAGMNYIRQ